MWGTPSGQRAGLVLADSSVRCVDIRNGGSSRPTKLLFEPDLNQNVRYGNFGLILSPGFWNLLMFRDRGIRNRPNPTITASS